ncbi:hypothetical protein [Clostridium saccharoperbutylacetonicum]|uniref:hypothetical protein n=1 Tax=Clostridium saccharoperbutylacetonicum TaxID=36745 RepID=UPI000983F21A|nr:hypothetical protein [Clostridium saccharoperbutylacetonicum]AQR98103.1 hypothetical protein CLSAP_54540 [Clostridium saccharoperbutylacetonicum]NSB33997.1 hypothetical protein [Clostridium saccharoperbutylacetonicum]
MAQINAKVYYDISTGKVLTITSEMEGGVIERTKVQDMSLYQQLKDKNIDEVDCITIPFGNLEETFKNAKSYNINLLTKKLNITYYTNDELEILKNQENELITLNCRISDISQYLFDQTDETISIFENYILQSELNKIMEGTN